MLLHDLAGNRVPRGRTVQTLDQPFLMPPPASDWWLEVQTGTGTHIPPSTSSPGLYEIATPATTNNSATLRTSFDIDTEEYEEIIWTVEGVHCDTDDNVDFRMGVEGTNLGVTARQLVAHSRVQFFQNPGSGTQTFINTEWHGNGEGQRHRNLTVLMRPQTKDVYFMSDDQVFGHLEGASWTNGLCRPLIKLWTQEAVSHYLRFARVSLILRSN